MSLRQTCTQFCNDWKHPTLVAPNMVHSAILLHSSNAVLNSHPNSTKLQIEELSLLPASYRCLTPRCKKGILFRVAFVCLDIQSVWEMAVIIVPQKPRLNKHNISVVVHDNLRRKVVIPTMAAIKMLLRLDSGPLDLVSSAINNSNSSRK